MVGGGAGNGIFGGGPGRGTFDDDCGGCDGGGSETLGGVGGSGKFGGNVGNGISGGGTGGGRPIAVILRRDATNFCSMCSWVCLSPLTLELDG
jgi:hypothetical protein